MPSKVSKETWALKEQKENQEGWAKRVTLGLVVNLVYLVLEALKAKKAFVETLGHGCVKRFFLNFQVIVSILISLVSIIFDKQFKRAVMERMDRQDLLDKKETPAMTVFGALMGVLERKESPDGTDNLGQEG